MYRTIEELIEGEGNVLRIDVHWVEGDGHLKQPRIASLGVWCDNQDGEGEYELCFRPCSSGWTLSGDGAGDPCVNGGSVLTGRDLG